VRRGEVVERERDAPRAIALAEARLRAYERYSRTPLLPLAPGGLLLLIGLLRGNGAMLAFGLVLIAFSLATIGIQRFYGERALRALELNQRLIERGPGTGQAAALD
jgi:hypothetical protein